MVCHMINIQPYLSKLDSLREYMEMRIDREGMIWMAWMNLQVCPTEYYIRNNLPIPQPYQKEINFEIKISFDEWLQTKN